MNQAQQPTTSGRRKRAVSSVSDMIYGKIPPQAKDLESAVLGALMLEKEAFDRVADILRPECFYVEAHQRIYRAMQALQQKSQPLDILTVVQELKSREEIEGIGGPLFVTKLTNSVVSAANIEAHARIVMQKFIQRELIRISGEIIQEAYEDSTDVFDLLDEAEQKILSIGQSNIQGDMKPIDKVLIEAFRQIEDWRKLDTAITGIPSGFPELDRATRGWQNSDLIILAARPSVGKSALAANIARNAAENPIKPVTVGIWSLEMKAVQNVLRMLSAESGVGLYRIQTGRLDDNSMKQLYTKGAQSLSGMKIFFDDNTGVNVRQLRAKARRLKKKYNLGLILLDYLQLMEEEEKRGTREQAIAKISRELKKLAGELDIPIIALSQLSRALETRTGKARQPQLSDLRESGAIEQDADMVIFLWGPEDLEIEQDASLLNRRYARIAKQRSGVLLTVDLDFQSEIQLFKPAGELALGPGNWRQVEVRNITEPKKEEGEDLPF